MGKIITYSKKVFISILFIIIFFITVFQSNVIADDIWEMVLSSNDFNIKDFLGDKFDVTLDGTIYCIDSITGNVIKYDENGETLLLSDSSSGYCSLCLSYDEETLYILSAANNSLTKYSLKTSNSEIIYLSEIGIGSDVVLTDIAYSPENEIYITDFSSNSLHIIKANNSLTTLSDTGGAGEFDEPASIDINSKGKIAVASQGRDVALFSGPYDNAFKAAVTIDSEGGKVQELFRAAIDDNNRIYHTDSATNRVVVYDVIKGRYITLYPSADQEYVTDICAVGNYLYVGLKGNNGVKIVRCAIENAIIGFSFPDIATTVQIQENKNMIVVTVPHDIDLATLKPNIVVPEGAAISLMSGNSYDFTNPVVCTVTTAIAGARDYTIIVTKETPPAVLPTSKPEVSQGTDPSSHSDETIIGELTSISDAFDAFELTEDMYESSSNTIFIIICMIAYLVLLILWIILIIIMRKYGKHKAFVILVILWIIAGIVIVLIGLAVTKDEIYPVYVQNADYEEEDFEPYEMSDDQENIIDKHGFPDGFVVLYVNRDRQETWFYYDKGLVLDFLGGIEIQRGYDEELTENGVQKTEFRPSDFVFAMSPGTALSQADLNSFLMMPLEEEMLQDGVLYYGEGIVFGFVNNKLYYVETILLEE